MPASNQTPERRLFDMFAAGVAYIATTDEQANSAVGTCFHIGDGIFITARHVVENRTITKIATTVASGPEYGSHQARAAKQIHGPYFHSDDAYDLAAFRMPDFSPPQIPFYDVATDGVDTELLLRSVVVMGYPPIPGSSSPILVCARGEVNASFVNYFDHQQVYIVSCMARGGFSGGPALTPPHHCLGVITRTMLKQPLTEELGFMAIVGPLPVLELLDFNGIMPGYLRTQIWEPLKKKKGC